MIQSSNISRRASDTYTRLAMIGAGSGTLPWQAKTVRKCIEKCYRDARRELNTESELLRDGLNILRAKTCNLPRRMAPVLESVEGLGPRRNEQADNDPRGGVQGMVP